MHKNRVVSAGGSHQFGIYLVGSQALDTLLHTGVILFTHGNPDIGVNGIRVADSLDHVAGKFNRGTALAGIFLRVPGQIIIGEQAIALVGQQIFVGRDQLPPTEEGEYYWFDLEGLEVHTTNGEVLGQVDRMMETGANDVLVIHGDRERLVPYIQGQYVKSVDLEAGQIVVDWDPDF